MLTAVQRELIKEIEATDDKAILVAGSWVYPEDVREDRKLAELVYRTIH